MIDLGPILI